MLGLFDVQRWCPRQKKQLVRENKKETSFPQLSVVVLISLIRCA